MIPNAPISNLDKGTLSNNPVMRDDLDYSIKIKDSQIAKVNGSEYVSLSNTLSDEELVILYWAKKGRPLSFIQRQLQINSAMLRQTVEKLRDIGILQIMLLSEEKAVDSFDLRFLWEKTVASFPDNTYVLDNKDNTFYSYREFNEIVKYITSTLISNGVGKGDKVLLHSDINFEAMGLFWACTHLGIVFMPVNAALAETVIDGLIEKYNPKMVFLSNEAAFQKKWQDKIVFFDVDENAVAGDKLFFSEWLSTGDEIKALPELSEYDLGVVLHTSGSTGMPKGVMLTQGQLFQSAINMAQTFSWTEKDNYLAVADLDSMSGLRNACIVTAVAGATCVIPSLGQKNNTTNLLTSIYETGITILVAVPGLLNLFTTKSEAHARLANVKCVLSTGSNLSTHLKTEFFKKTGKKIYNYYGLTETTGLCIAEPLSSSHFNGNFIGYPVDCIVKIIDENDNKVKIGEIGELIIYSYSISKGYYTVPGQITDEVQKWFYTGDLVQMAPDGAIELMGRKSDFIKNTRGEIVYFKEIEDSLSKLPFISDFGIISFLERESEKAALFIEVNDTSAESKNIVEEVKKALITMVGMSKMPSVIKIVKKIPRNKNGKLAKTELNQHL